MIDINAGAVKHLQTLIDNIVAGKIAVLGIEIKTYPDNGDYNEIYKEYVPSRVFADIVTYKAIEEVTIDD